MTAREEAVFLFGTVVLEEAERRGARAVALEVIEPEFWPAYRSAARHLNALQEEDRPAAARGLPAPVARALALAVLGEGFRETLLELTLTNPTAARPRLRLIRPEEGSPDV
jgi:hypothetical protein